MTKIGKAGEVSPPLRSNLLREVAQYQNPFVGNLEPGEGVVLVKPVDRWCDQTIPGEDNRGRLKYPGLGEGQRAPVAIESVILLLGFAVLTHGELVPRPE